MKEKEELKQDNLNVLLDWITKSLNLHQKGVFTDHKAKYDIKYSEWILPNGALNININSNLKKGK